MNNQTLYDQTVRHLRSMPGPSVTMPEGADEALCAYRGEGGARCAVGYWIPDEKYRPEMEGIALGRRNTGNNPVIAALSFVPTQNQINILQELQVVHDSALHGKSGWRLDVMRLALEDVAKENKLSTAVLDEFTWT